MKFEKKNHHYVPQFWQRGFIGPNGYLFGKIESRIKRVSPKSIMKSDWLYTEFDEQWNPSDALEDTLSILEAEHARLFQRLHAQGHIPTHDDHDQLCAALALQASRHPDVLARGHRRAKELSTLLTNVHSIPLDEFKNRMGSFGVSESDAHDFYVLLLPRSPAQLADELAELTALSPQSSELPMHDALRAAPVIKEALQELDFWLLDAPPPEAFVLGDTPIPQSDLGSGFTVPLSQSLAVLAIPALTPQPVIQRRNATTSEIREINRQQSDNALSVIIGPSAALLQSL